MYNYLYKLHLEGLDRSGKSTQCDLLVRELREKYNHPSILYRFPNRSTSIGQTINNYLSSKQDLSDKSIHLLFSANRWEFETAMLNHIQEGNILIVDRYCYSGVAYSSAKGLDLNWCISADRGLPRPDLVLFLDISLEDIKKRGEFGKERYEDTNFLERVLDAYNRLEDTRYWRRVSALGTVDEVTSRLLDEIFSLIERNKNNENNDMKKIFED